MYLLLDFSELLRTGFSIIFLKICWGRACADQSTQKIGTYILNDLQARTRTMSYGWKQRQVSNNRANGSQHYSAPYGNASIGGGNGNGGNDWYATGGGGNANGGYGANSRTRGGRNQHQSSSTVDVVMNGLERIVNKRVEQYEEQQGQALLSNFVQSSMSPSQSQGLSPPPIGLGGHSPFGHPAGQPLIGAAFASQQPQQQPHPPPRTPGEIGMACMRCGSLEH